MSRRKVYAVNINKTKLLMKSKGLTQVKLGELVGTSYQNIQKFKWNRNILLNVCAILCCEPEDILLQELGEDTEIYRFTLRELKERDREVYNKAIDDFVQKVKEHQYLLSDVINSKDYGMFTVGIEQIAEELKEGADIGTDNQ